MTAEEVFCDLNDKYGEEFNWNMVPFTNKTFVAELKREIGEKHFLYNERIWAVAKCDSNDDVLYVCGHEGDSDIYYIFHLTYSKHNTEGFPKYEKFIGIEAVKEHIEQLFVNEYL
jgi:hypothetical protein